jgi:uncharacterized protein
LDGAPGLRLSDQSAIHGLGLFSLERIPKGTQVWRFTTGFDFDLDVKSIEEHPANVRERLLQYGYVDCRLNRYTLCCDDARFINHSDAPNIRPDFTLEKARHRIALRDIAAGDHHRPPAPRGGPP